MRQATKEAGLKLIAAVTKKFGQKNVTRTQIKDLVEASKGELPNWGFITRNPAFKVGHGEYAVSMARFNKSGVTVTQKAAKPAQKKAVKKAKAAKKSTPKAKKPAVSTPSKLDAAEASATA